MITENETERSCQALEDKPEFRLEAESVDPLLFCLLFCARVCVAFFFVIYFFVLPLFWHNFPSFLCLQFRSMDRSASLDIEELKVRDPPGVSFMDSFDALLPGPCSAGGVGGAPGRGAGGSRRPLEAVVRGEGEEALWRSARTAELGVSLPACFASAIIIARVLSALTSALGAQRQRAACPLISP